MLYLVGLLAIVSVAEAVALIKLYRDKRFLNFKYEILLKSFEDFIKNKNTKK